MRAVDVYLWRQGKPEVLRGQPVEAEVEDGSWRSCGGEARSGCVREGGSRRKGRDWE